MDLGARGDDLAAAAAALLEEISSAHYAPYSSGAKIDANGEVTTLRRHKVKVLRQAAGRLQAIDGRQPAKKGALYPIACAVRSGIVANLERDPSLDATALSRVVEVESRLRSADAIFPRKGTAEGRMKMYEKEIALVLLRLNPSAALKELAEKIVIACAGASAKAAGRPSPRGLFDAGTKAKKRRAAE